MRAAARNHPHGRRSRSAGAAHTFPFSEIIISSLDAAALGSDLVVADGEDGTAMAALHHGMDEEAGDDHTEEDIGDVGVLGDVLESLGAVEQALAQHLSLIHI